MVAIPAGHGGQCRRRLSAPSESRSGSEFPQAKSCRQVAFAPPHSRANDGERHRELCAVYRSATCPKVSVRDRAPKGFATVFRPQHGGCELSQNHVADWLIFVFRVSRNCYRWSDQAASLSWNARSCGAGSDRATAMIMVSNGCVVVVFPTASVSLSRMFMRAALAFP